ncbi:MAG: T9SS type A sorting domain-containing protein, partial [Bacteroidota bacterium]
GFIVQEVEKAAADCGYAFDGIHIPSDTSNGNYSVSYAQFVVPLVKAVQELSKTVDSMSVLLSACCSTNVKTINSAVPSTDVELASNAAILYQNYPNPFGDGTVIRYFVPDKTSHASIVFYDEYGNEIKNAELPNKGQTAELNLSTFNLAAGIYSYSLVVNDRVIDTKKMLKTK